MFNKIETLNIFGIKVSKLNYSTFIQCIKDSIKKNEKLTIAYANADTLNRLYNDENLKEIYDSFCLIHPDGIGFYLASKFLYKENGLEERLTGSDFYSLLIEESINNNWSYFFLGHNQKILESIKRAHPALNITGFQEGYEFENSKVLQFINKVSPDIVIIGLSFPIQEKWIYENRDKINSPVLFAVGDGIRVFADKKIRGPLFLRKMGLEWLVRYLTNPVSNFKKYIIGNPLFIFRVLKEKRKLK